MSDQWQLQLEPLYGDEPVKITGTSDDLVQALAERFPTLIDEVDGEDIHAIVEHLNSRVQAYDFNLSALGKLEKAWPKNDAENTENKKGFFGSPEWQVAEDQHLEQGGGVDVRSQWKPTSPPSMKGLELGGPTTGNVSPVALRRRAGQDPAQVAMESGNEGIIRARRANQVANGDLIPTVPPPGEPREWDGGPFALGQWPAGSPPEPTDAHYGWSRSAGAARHNYPNDATRPDHAYWEGVSESVGVPPEQERFRAREAAKAKGVVGEREKGIMWRLRNVKPVAKSEGNLQQLVEDMLGFNPTKIPEFRAAKLLARHPGGVNPPLEQMRRAIYEHPSDMVAAALQGMGLVITDSNREALRQVQEISTLQPRPMRKAQDNALDPNLLAHIRALDDDGQELEQHLRQAIAAHKYEQVALEGKHSKGTLLVQTEHGNWLLKPG